MSSDDEPKLAKLWASALRKYQEETGKDIRNDSLLMSLHNTDDLLNKVEVEHRDFEHFRKHKAKLCDSIMSALRPIELLGSIAQGP